MFDQKIDFYNSTNLKSYNLDAIMQYQLSMFERLDPFTRKHSENVANLCCRICEYLHCPKSFTIHTTIAGYLHDIGKLFIPYGILSKPGALTTEEFEIMKNHTTLGYEMCMKDLRLRPYSDGPYYHHEGLDGSGYPQGLTKKDIPYTSQIIRVADEYDAIVTKRQYKTHVHISDTLKELIKDAQPTNKAVALDMLNEHSKDGKISPKPLKALFKVVIDDTYYEISCVMDYIKYLEGEVKRLETIEKYAEKANNSRKDKDKDYYHEGMKMLFSQGENFDNFAQVLNEYRDAIRLREEVKGKLYEEIKIIKKLRV